MENEEIKYPEQTPQSKPEQQESVPPTLENFVSELANIKASIKKRKSETATLKILFYTGIAVLFFGFIYTNQTLQRAQSQNIESNINYLQSQVNHTLLMLENKLHREIQDIEAKLNGNSAPNLQQTIQRMNQALDQLAPQTISMGILVKKVQRDANELSQMVSTTPPQVNISPTAMP